MFIFVVVYFGLVLGIFFGCLVCWFVLGFFETGFLCVVCYTGDRLTWAPETREAAAVTWRTQAGVRGDWFLDMLCVCTDTVDQ